MNILAFCFFPAFVPPANGGQSRLFNFYRALSSFHDVTLITSTHIDVEEEVILHGPGFLERRVPKDHFFIREYAGLEKYAGGGDLSGPAIAASSKYSTKLHAAYLEEYEKADVIIHDFPFTAQYDIFLGFDPKLRVYNAHNCESLLYRQLHPDEKSAPIWRIVQEAEIHLLKNVDLVFYCSDADLAEFHRMHPEKKFEAVPVPNGMSRRRPLKKPKESTGRVRAVFMGSAHPPNIQAAEFIARRIAERMPQVDFDIIGGCLLGESVPSNVRCHGLVSEEVKEQLLANASVALNPMSAGCGSNVKVLDYLAHELPVLSTSFGMRGIDAKAGVEYIEGELENFADALESALTDRDILARIARSGRLLVEGRYTWDAIAKAALSAIDTWRAQKLKGFGPYVLVLNDYDSFASPGGGGVRTRGLYAAVKKWSTVVFISFSGDSCIRVRMYDESIFVINVPKTQEHITELCEVNSQFHVSASDIIASHHCLNNPWMSAIYRILRKYARCVVLEHCYMAPLPCAWGDRFVYSSHNNELELKSALLAGHPASAQLLQTVAKLERFTVECSATTIAVSSFDAESLVKHRKTAAPIVVIRNGAAVPVRGKSVEELREEFRSKIGRRSAVFLGSAHMPNIEAARFIVDILASQCRDVQFHMVGAVCNAIENMPRNVTPWGILDEEAKSAVLQSCALAINPMFSGGGSNVKLADYLAHGLFVVTTEFGVRGYPAAVRDHIDVVDINNLAGAINKALSRHNLNSSESREARQLLFRKELCMQELAERFSEVLRGLELKKKRVLYVAYRYVEPALGGAEVNMERFIRALGNCGTFDVDVVAPEVSEINNYWRFGERYKFDAELGVPIDMANVRFARFPADAMPGEKLLAHLRRVWRFQPRFEKSVSDELALHYSSPGLTWGWSYSDGLDNIASRWAFSEAGIYLTEPGEISIEAYALDSVVITAYHSGVVIAGPWSVKGQFDIKLDSLAGEVVFATSAPVQEDDPRPLGFQVLRLSVGGGAIDLSLPLLWQRQLSNMSADAVFRILHKAAQATRAHANIRLTDGRGPWSEAMEKFIIDHVADYDLVVAHNSIFRPAVVAMAEAKKHGIPSVLIPHVHLDDDFYHFPDVLQCARDAGLVLAAPKAACSFLADNSCNVRYLSAGCDVHEKFDPEDVEAFREIFPSKRPFILVLGRKAGAKGYRATINAVEKLNKDGYSLHVVLIGPDDDGVPISSPHATYIGRQSRKVVRGALLSCIALCNMSVSESFGIVLLEAWLAGKPVVVNRNCVAFHDMAVDGENALFVDEASLADGLVRIMSQPEFAEELAKRGREIVDKFDWDVVCEKFVNLCCEFVGVDH